MSRARAAGRFTLIVPTYNRPAEFARLLRYLERHRVEFRVLVLDSSAPETQIANRAAAAAVNCNLAIESFEPSMPPWEKFRRGSNLVDTPYSSLCADDDLVLPESLDHIVAFMDTHADHSVAHGWYFSFHDGPRIGITGSAYSGASLDHDDPLERLYIFFRNYEAVTYGVYRTDVMRSILGDVRGVDSMLGKELLSGALSIVRGKAHRLPVFYYGRSHTPSHPYLHWHPLDMLSSSPDALYRDYSVYREVLLACFKSVGYRKYSEDELVTLIDLMHFRYLADYVRPNTVEYLVAQVMAKTDKAAIMHGLWPVLAQEGTSSTVAPPPSPLAVLGRMRDRFFPKLKFGQLMWPHLPADAQTMSSATTAGHTREYLLYPGFLSTVRGNKALENEVPRVLAALDRYE